MSTRKLKELHRGKPNAQVTVVVIAGTGTLSPKHWSDTVSQNGLFTPLIPPSAPVYEFEHSLNSHRSLNRTRIETEGGRLWSQLQSLKRRSSTLILVAHSLGGILLKHAVALGHQRQALSDLDINSIILLSCPNFKSGDPAGRNSLVAIAREYAMFDLSPEGADVLLPGLIETAETFVEAVTTIPICTVYEQKPTSVKNGRPVFLVDKATAALERPSEKLLSAPSDHNNSCRIHSSSLLWNGLDEFLEAPLRGKHDTTSSVAQHRLRPSLGGDHRLHVRNASPSSSRPLSAAGFRSDASNAGSREQSTTISEHIDIQPDPKIPCHYIPYGKNNAFHGRTWELRKIEACICTTTNAGKFRGFAVTGNGGMGKSQIVNEFVHRHKDQFDVILWIAADDREKMEQAYAAIAIQLRLVQEDSVQARDKIYARRLVLDWLAKPLKSFAQNDGGHPPLADWLVIFDNVDDPDLLIDFWPYAENGAVLVTSRDQIINSQFYEITEGLPLEPFGAQESAELLLQCTGRSLSETNQKDVDEVVKIIDGLPLAVFQMAGVIARQQMGFDEFVEQYQDEKKRERFMGAKMIGLRANEYSYTLASVWRFEKLKSSRRLVDVLSFLDPDGIPESIVSNLGQIKTDIQGSLEADYDYHDARAQLLSMSLVTRDINNKRLVIHRLVQEAARTRMSDEEYSAVLISDLQLMHAVWPQKDDPAFRNETDSWKQCETLFTHLIKLGKLAEEKKWCPPLKGTMERMNAVDVLLEAAWFGLMQSKFDETLKLLNVADRMLLTFAKTHEPTNGAVEKRRKDLSAIFEHHFGVLALHTNKPPDSLRHLKAHRDMLEDNYPEEYLIKDSRWGVAWNELGNAYLQNQRAITAEECFRKSINVLNSLESTTTNTLSMPQINLAFALWLQNRLEEAEEEFVAVLEQRAYAYGEDDTVSFAVGKLCLGYGNVMLGKQDVVESMKLHERCVKRYTDTLGPLHHRTADGSVRLADHYIRERRFSEAEKLLTNAAIVYGDKDIFRPERARVAYKQYRLASAHGGSDAQPFAEKALALYHEIHPDEHRRVEELSDEDFDNSIMFWSR